MATGGKNLRDQGYPSSYSSSSSGTGLNLSQKGYPDSKSGGTVAKTTTNNGVRKLSGSTGSGATTATAAAATDGSYMADAYNALLSAYGSRQSEYENYLAQMRQAAQDAYDRGMNALNNAYDKQMSSLSDNLNSTKGQLLDSFNRSKSNINSDAESSLRQAYINRMISERNLLNAGGESRPCHPDFLSTFP